MLTIKTRNAKGNENLFEARRVEYLDTKAHGEKGFLMPGVYISYEDGGETSYEAGSGYKIWVMNRHGSTVATYNL